MRQLHLRSYDEYLCILHSSMNYLVAKLRTRMSGTKSSVANECQHAREIVMSREHT